MSDEPFHEVKAALSRTKAALSRLALNKRFAIEIAYCLKDETQFVSFTIDAAEFFEFSEDIDESKWSFELPWRELQLHDYLRGRVDQVASLSWLRLDIHDHDTSQRRRILEQYWEAGEWFFEWIRDANGCEHCRQTIAVVRNPGDPREHILKASLGDGTFHIVSHTFGDWKSPDTLGHLEVVGFDVPKSPDQEQSPNTGNT